VLRSGEAPEVALRRAQRTAVAGVHPLDAGAWLYWGVPARD
jgi:hypothetical protein